MNLFATGVGLCAQQAVSAAPEPEPLSTIQSEPHDGTWLDEDIRLLGDEGAFLLDIVLLMVGEDAPSRRDYKENFERRVECVLANALRAHFYRETNHVAYRRGSNDYAGRPRWLSAPSLRSMVDRLAAAGLIDLASGQWAGFNLGVGHASTFWIEDPLRTLIEFCGVTSRTVGKPVPPRSGLIKLRASENEGKCLLPFTPTDHTSAWASDLDNYNRFADEHEVDIAALSSQLEGRLLAGWNKHLAEHSRQPPLTRPEFFNRHLQRIFNDGTFDHGGRLFGAWYQYVPAWLRRRILINDCSTIELDYSGMSLRMLHHLVGNDYQEDPYAIAELETYAARTGHRRTYFRNSIKKLVQAMLNNEDGDCHPEMIRLEESFRPKYTRKQVRDMILERHESVNELFGSGMGKALQRVEADIALDVIVSLMEEGILCLPIHDSFIVIETHEERLHDQMIDSYRNRLSFDPIIKVH
jgi:hypothetical protein